MHIIIFDPDCNYRNTEELAPPVSVFTSRLSQDDRTEFQAFAIESIENGMTNDTVVALQSGMNALLTGQRNIFEAVIADTPGAAQYVRFTRSILSHDQKGATR